MRDLVAGRPRTARPLARDTCGCYMQGVCSTPADNAPPYRWARRMRLESRSVCPACLPVPRSSCCAIEGAPSLRKGNRVASAPRDSVISCP
eukprot:12050779-Alexandrium_andersonii.AAC.1